MQKLKISNSYNNSSITFDIQGNYILRHIEGLGIPDSDVGKTKCAFLDGAIRQNAILKERVLKVQVTVKGNTREHMYQLRREVYKTLNTKGTLNIEYTNDFGTYRAKGNVEDIQDFNERINNNCKATLTLICDDPYWYAKESTKDVLKYCTGGLTFPIIFPTFFEDVGYEKIVRNDGDVETHVKIVYKGEVRNPLIENLTTGKKLKIERTLNAGTVLEINTKDGEQTVEIVNGDTRTDVFNYLSLDSDIDFCLEIGENKIKFGSDSDNSEVEVDIIHTDKFIGV